MLLFAFKLICFVLLARQVQSMNYSVIVFDTAPTGHTLRLLSFPSLLEKAFEKIAALKNRFSGVFQQVRADPAYVKCVCISIAHGACGV